MTDDPIQIKKETIEIEGERKLYNYTFTVEGEEEEPPEAGTAPGPPQ